MGQKSTHLDIKLKHTDSFHSQISPEVANVFSKTRVSIRFFPLLVSLFFSLLVSLLFSLLSALLFALLFVL